MGGKGGGIKWKGKIMTIGITRNHHQVPTSQATGVLPPAPFIRPSQSTQRDQDGWCGMLTLRFK